ncbi:HAMP domain-containing sensor histidine kinase [Saccharothrix algeriensis]|uniref:Signal transduction histidine-protein kinase/phosphatase MprB n=1 Tax=Catellatospora bangladeshensis TaxID=310355 RepID=A0A8J3JXF2_9ACTN|nr:HAMP domain-containing sensor histidine kinase [Catellatospora bangladeshensis]GIF85444.1 two-component sensor histidine kinase [Catellatospora bangladeshensis]
MIRRPGLRARVTAGFAVGALGASTVVGVLSYQLTERFLLAEREASAVRAVAQDARIVAAGLDAEPPDALAALSSLDTGPNRRALIRRDGRWYSSKADTANTIEDIPVELVGLAEQGRPAIQRVRVAGTPAMVVAMPLSGDTYLYEVDFMRELDRSLKVLALVLTMVAAVTTGAGALLGSWAARRVLRPLTSIADAAREIAAGDHSTRLDPAAEPELERLTTSFNLMVDQLSRRMERDRRFAADVSHELRSPLQTLANAASVLARRRAHLDQRTATAAALLAEEVARFQVLVTDLIELSRSDRHADRAAVDVPALARRLCQARGLPPDLVGTAPATDAIWQVDRRRIEQILANLLDNAQRHGGGVVAVRLARRDGAYLIQVDDDGPGVSPDDREAIFDRFVRGRSGARGDGDGTGLGLALVAQHAEAHGGRAGVADRPGGGARFEVVLPRVPS